MWRYFDISVSDFGIILVACGIVCVILGLTRRAHAPKLSLIFGFLLLLCGGLMWLIPRLDIPENTMTKLTFLLVGAALLSFDLVNYFKRRKCTVPWRGEYRDISTYGRRNSGLVCGSAVFSYIVDGALYERASLDKRFWLGFMSSPFKKKFTVGDCCDIYLDPHNPNRIALSRRPHFGLLSYCGALLLVGAMLY